MKVLVQRCKAAHVKVEDRIVGAIEHGLVVLVGITHTDGVKDAQYLVDKIKKLRIFEDECGNRNSNVQDVNGSILSISQFTLYGRCVKGTRPSFTAAAPAAQAEDLYYTFNHKLRATGLRVETGQFGATMDVTLTNWGPITLLLESPF